MPLHIHHMHVSQSERILWLAEELQIPYTLTLHTRSPIFSPPSITTLHPLGQAPIIQDGPLTLAESGACIEYILAKFDPTHHLSLLPSDPNYPHYIYWLHFANGGLQPAVLRAMQVRSAVKAAGVSEEAIGENAVVRRCEEGVGRMLAFMDGHLEGREWLAGDRFTAADVMCVFTLTTMRAFAPLDLSGYERILAYLGKVVKRDGYRRMREKGDQGLELMVGGKPPVQFVERLRAEGKL